jgi:hypothetical protein
MDLRKSTKKEPLQPCVVVDCGQLNRRGGVIGVNTKAVSTAVSAEGVRVMLQRQRKPLRWG